MDVEENKEDEDAIQEAIEELMERFERENVIR